MPRMKKAVDGFAKSGSGGAMVSRIRDASVDLDELARLRNEVERLRNDLFLARGEISRLRREVRLDTYQKLVESLGHELRTSLTLVLGWTELLLDDKLPPEKHGQAHDTIYAAGWRVEAALRALERTIERDVRAAEAQADLPPDTVAVSS